ncbi:MAG: monovalent cation:proton antiporter family protein [Anaerolineales bacterium]
MEETRTFAPLLIVIFLAFLVPLGLSRFRRIRLPIVVGEILAGILIGRSGLGWVQQHDPVLDLLAEFGFVFLFFLAGTEIDFSSFLLKIGNGAASAKEKFLGILPLSFYSYGLTLIFSLVAGWWVVSGGYVTNPWLMALIIAPSSLGIIVAVLKEQSFSRTRLGQAILTTALVADFGTLLLFTISIAIVSSGLTLEILLIGVLFVAFVFMYRFGNFFFNRLKPVRRAMEELSTATAQIKVRAAFTLLLIFVVLSEVVGTEIVLGAFLAGAIVSLLATPDDRDAMHQLEAVGFGFFIPIFFIMIGVNFNLEALLNSPRVSILNIPQAFLLVPVFVLIAVAVKFFPSLLFKLHFGWRETVAIGTLMSARLSLIVAEAEIVQELGVIDESVNGAIILTAMLLATFAPIIFNRLAKKEEEEAQAPILIIGAGELGLQVARQLIESGRDILLIDPDESRILRAKQHALPAIAACVDDQDPSTAPYFRKAHILINTYNDSELNYRICKLARETFEIDTVVTHVVQPTEIERFKQLGVTTMNPALDQAALLVLLALNPSAYELLTRSDDTKAIREVLIANSQLVGKNLRSIFFPGDVLVLALRRNGDLIVPHGNTVFELFDQLTLVGSHEDVDAASMIFR